MNLIGAANVPDRAVRHLQEPDVPKTRLKWTP